MPALSVFLDQPVSFHDGVRLQNELAAARLAGAIPDVVLFLEHRPVVTMGCRGRTNHLLASPQKLAAMNIDLVHATRGGDLTYHAPGQLILYPIIKLGEKEADAHGYLHNLEEIAIRTADSFGVRAFRRPGLNGAWTDRGKLAAIGFRLKRWVTLHGMSFNVNVDLAGFQTIVPCGLVGEPVTSLAEILGSAAPDLAMVREKMARHFQDVCGRKTVELSRAESVPAVLSAILSRVDAKPSRPYSTRTS